MNGLRERPCIYMIDDKRFGRAKTHWMWKMWRKGTTISEIWMTKYTGYCRRTDFKQRNNKKAPPKLDHPSYPPDLSQ